jgi:uncharacterized membrane protein YbhN (UPF0104 family)
MKRILSFVLKLLISSVLLYIFFSQVDINTVREILKQTKIPLFVAGFFIYMSTIFISTKRWSLFLPQGMNYFKLVSLYFIGSFFNTFLPGLVGGDAVKAFYLYRHIGKGGLSLAAVFMDRYMGLIAMAGIALIASIGGYTYIKGTEIVWVILVFIGALLLASLFLWKVNWGKIKFLSSFYAPLMEYKSKRKTIYKGLMLGFAVQGLGITSVYFLSLSIGLKVSIVYFFMFIPIISAASAIPVSVAGLGIREAGYVILFTKIGVTSAEALSLSLLVFITMVLLNLIGGIEYLRIGKPPKKESLESGV